MTGNNFIKGIGLGLVVGSAIGVCMVPQKRYSKNMVGKALKTMGEVIENISDAIM